MIIDFENIKKETITHMKDGKGTLYIQPIDDDTKKIARITIPQGSSIGSHTHTEGDEVVYTLSGRGICHDSKGDHALVKGLVNYCKTGEYHSIENIEQEDLVVFVVINK
ncbi:MAG: cupin domain-containing protein [Bacilli bacterium]